MATYKTAEVAAMIGVHPNTVRLYEKMKLIPKPERLSNGYRVFTDFHIWQCKLIRLAFQVEVLQNGLRKKIVRMVTVSAAGEFDTAIILTEEYLKQLRQERRNAEEAIKILGLPIENVLLPVGFMGAVIFICFGISVKCFKWE